MAKKNLEKITVEKIADFRYASSEMQYIIARKYMRTIIKYNNDEINRLIGAYCDANKIDTRQEELSPYARVKVEFARQFTRTNDGIAKAYDAQMLYKNAPKLVDIMDLYSLYCFNEFQKQVIRQWREAAKDNFKAYDTIDSLRDSIGLIFNSFTFSTGKYNHNNYHVPTVSQSGTYNHMRAVCFQNSRIQCNQPDLSEYELILPEKDKSKKIQIERRIQIERHIQMYTKAMLAKEFALIKGEKIEPDQVIVTFMLDDIEYEQRIIQYTEAKAKKNLYFVNENRRNAQLDPEVQQRRSVTYNHRKAQEEIEEYIRHNTIYINGERFVKRSDGLYVDEDEQRLDCYEGTYQYAFTRAGTRDLYYGHPVYERCFNNEIDEYELREVAKDLVCRPDDHVSDNNQQSREQNKDDIME